MLLNTLKKLETTARHNSKVAARRLLNRSFKFKVGDITVTLKFDSAEEYRLGSAEIFEICKSTGSLGSCQDCPQNLFMACNGMAQLRCERPSKSE